MNWCLLDKIFDNGSVSTLIGVLGAGFVAVWTFWRQRKLTKFENVSENVQILIEKCEYVNLILDRVSNSYLLIKTSEFKNKEPFLESSKEEFARISLIINDEIPKTRAKIKNYFNLNYSEDERIIKNLTSFFEELKNWHTNVVNIAFSGYEFEKRIKDNDKFSLDKIQNTAKILTESVR